MLLITSILTFQSAAHTKDNNSASILYHESIRLAAETETGKGSATLAMIDAPVTLTFDAFGRRFTLRSDDTRALAGTGFTRLRGELAGLPGSWFNILRDGEELSGIIADGVDTYLVEPHRRVSELLIEAPADTALPNVIFRLADILMPSGLMSCATHDGALHTDESAGESDDRRVDGQTAFTNLGAELQAATKNQSATRNSRLTVGVVADASFSSSHATRSEIESEITTIFNTVQGIFAHEIGIEIELDRVFSVTPDVTDPFSATLVATDLLEELGKWRNNNQAILGHTHLLTRKTLLNTKGDSLAGISYVGIPARSGICSPTTGASLSRDIRGLTALIVAHEIGHNLGAPHDGDPGGACAAVPNTAFIMSSNISRSTAVEFSGCSITQINKVIAAASCLNQSGQTLPASVPSGNGGGGSTLGWLSLAGLFASMILRRKRTESAHPLPAKR